MKSFHSLKNLPFKFLSVLHSHEIFNFSVILSQGSSEIRVAWGFPGGSVVKNPPANAENVSSTPGSGWSLREENGNPLWYSCLGNPIDREAWQVTVCGVTKELNTTEELDVNNNLKTVLKSDRHGLIRNARKICPKIFLWPNEMPDVPTVRASLDQSALHLAENWPLKMWDKGYKLCSHGREW